MLSDRCLSVCLSVCLSCLSVTVVYCCQTVGWIKMKLGMWIGLDPRHSELDGDPAAAPPKGHSSPQFSAHICCGQMDGWIKMLPGMEVGFGPGDFVLDGVPAPPPREPPIFGPRLLWPNGWMDQDGTWHGDGPRSRPHCARWRPSSPSPKGAQLPQFSANVHCGQTAGWTKMPLGMV